MAILIDCAGKFCYRQGNFQNTEAATGGVLKIQMSFTKFTGKHLWLGLFLNKVAGLRPATLLKKETPTQVFCCEL